MTRVRLASLGHVGALGVAVGGCASKEAMQRIHEQQRVAAQGLASQVVAEMDEVVKLVREPEMRQCIEGIQKPNMFGTQYRPVAPPRPSVRYSCVVQRRGDSPLDQAFTPERKNKLAAFSVELVWTEDQGPRPRTQTGYCVFSLEGGALKFNGAANKMLVHRNNGCRVL